MCKINDQCSIEKGLCIHEKMMLGILIQGIMMLSALAAIAYWVLRLFWNEL
ncbi:MAG: hypothetical protein ISR72_08690 [Methylobacter sp.]|nr:hypothetical protein [Methylobacter sp.]